MANDLRMSFYFRAGKINFGKRTMEALDMPEYIHLLIDWDNKWLFLEPCEKDKNAFDIQFAYGEKEQPYYHINAMPLLKGLAKLLGVSPNSKSMRFIGQYMKEEGMLFFDLNRPTRIHDDPIISIDKWKKRNKKIML